MTFDFLLGFATPGCKAVRQAPGGIKKWFATAMYRKIVAMDGFVYMAAIRLLGITIGTTITRECDNSSLPQFSSQQPPIPPAVMAAAQAMQNNANLSRSNGGGSTGQSGPTLTVLSGK